VERSPAADSGESPDYLERQLITYIGSKRALLPLIGQAIATVRAELGRSRLSIADLFSGSGVVARYMKQYARLVIANDLEEYSRVTNECYLSNAADVPTKDLTESLSHLRRAMERDLSPGFLTELYAPRDESSIRPQDRVFYTRRNAIYLDTARRAIGELPERLRHYLLAPLIAKASVHTNTSGVFKGFYKDAQGVGRFGGDGRNALTRILGDIALELPVLSRFSCDYRVLKHDANVLIADLPEVDLAYIDPPYNQHPYGSNYFMLNLIADYRRPEDISRVSGIPTDWRRSDYNKRREAQSRLLTLLRNCPAKYLLLSYNSEGFVNKDRLVEELQSLGRLTILEQPYNTFRGSRNLHGRALHVTEYLFLLRKK